MARTQLNKQLYTDITKLKLLHAKSTPKFILDQSPFNNNDDEDGGLESATSSNRIVIIGRILPDSEIYNQGAYQIEMRLTPHYPFDPPEVRFITKIYHPNVSPDGEFCHELIRKTAKWTNRATLVDVITAVTKHIDKPDIEFTLSLSLGYEYQIHRPEFNRKALEFVKKHALPRI